MPTIRYPYKGPCPAAYALHLACFALIVMAIGVNASGQEQSQPPQTLPQEESNHPDASVEPERWNLFYQATSIGDEHGTFRAPYGGPLSLANYPEHDVSLSSTLFFSVRLEQNTIFVFNPEIAG